MVWILLLIGLGLIALFAVVLVRAIRLTSKQMQVDPTPPRVIDERDVAERLARALKFETISYEDAARIERKAFDELNAYLEQAFPRVHARLTKEVVANHSLLYTWKGQDEGLNPILLMAHTDVVPAEPGPEGGWTYHPFEGHIAEGYIWGRGALDFKDALMGILEAVELLLKDGFQPQRTIFLAFGHDEEIGGQKGAAQIAALLDSRGVHLEFVLDEGLTVVEGILPTLPRPVALVGLAEKGFVSIELTVKAKGGHSSMPPQHTAVGVLSSAIHQLERDQMPARLEIPTRLLFRYLAPEMPFVMRLLFANLWITEGLVKRQLSASPATNALVRTTTAATMFEAGVKANILPQEARAVVNFRVLPGDRITGVIEHVRKVIDDPRVAIRALNGFGSEPSAVSDAESASFDALVRTVRQVFPDVIVAPGLVLAATDSRHYGDISDNVYRFSPIRLAGEDLGRIHGTDERIPVEDYARAVRFYAELICNTGCV